MKNKVPITTFFFFHRSFLSEVARCRWVRRIARCISLLLRRCAPYTRPGRYSQRDSRYPIKLVDEIPSWTSTSPAVSRLPWIFVSLTGIEKPVLQPTLWLRVRMKLWFSNAKTRDVLNCMLFEDTERERVVQMSEIVDAIAPSVDNLWNIIDSSVEHILLSIWKSKKLNPVDGFITKVWKIINRCVIKNYYVTTC